MILKDYLFIFQLEDYKPKRLIKWVFSKHYKHDQIRHLIWTPRAKRLFALSLVTYLIAVTIFYNLFPLYFSLVLTLFFWANSYFFLITSFYIFKPYEWTNRKIQIAKTANILIKFPNLKIIGITGSYGKTSTKHILYKLLKPKALETPKSFNTLFGVLKVAKYELCERYKYFLVEMGAYKKGEIKELCSAFRPSVSVLTGINEQHLERFGNIENTKKAKFEIIESLKYKGTAVVNLDDKNVYDGLSAVSRTDINFVGYTMEEKTHPKVSKVIALKNLEFNNYYSYLELAFEDSNFLVKTRLLGQSHAQNILASSACAYILGENPKEICKKIESLEQIEHRLYFKRESGINILDNTYSSNIKGFMDSVNLLSKLEGRKIIATPGIVELGKNTEEIHKKLGNSLKDKVNLVILVGMSQRLKCLKEGLLECGFDEKNIVEVKNNTELNSFLSKNLKFGDSILFENDLPDNYL